jgi:hypothetical protein
MLGGFHENVTPSRVDRSVLGKFSGIVGSQLLTTLRFFGHIDGHGKPSKYLEDIVAAYGSEQWPKVLEEQLRRAYGPVFELDLKTASPAQFTETFKSAYPAEGDTLRKALTFFLNGARDAQIPINTLITKNKKPRSGAPRKQRSAKPVSGGQSGNHAKAQDKQHDKSDHGTDETLSTFKRDLLNKFPPYDPSWPDNIKAEWFKGFDQFMQMTKEK